MKIALCFIINYEHILNKETIWREWIEHNQDIINVYFFYKDYNKIKSSWIAQHAIPPKFIVGTNYYHMIPAYISLLNYAFNHDHDNKWFCMLTDSCCPIISPLLFRDMFFKYNKYSIMSWNKCWWNIKIHQRSNLERLDPELHLANNPWFILNRENVKQVFNFFLKQPKLTKIICDGGIANESLFAIIFKIYGSLYKNIINETTHLTDWSKPSSSTSPHVFKYADDFEIKFIEKQLERNNLAVFIRKIDPEFPDEILRKFIYKEKNNENDDSYIINIIFLSILFINIFVLFSGILTYIIQYTI